MASLPYPRSLHSFATRSPTESTELTEVLAENILPQKFTELTEVLAENILPQISQICTDC